MRFISGLANCHLPGLYSLVISERESEDVGMKRVFYASPFCKMHLWEGADFLLRPHNHRQDITLTLLFGQAQNVLLKTGFGIHRVFCYAFQSALLHGEFDLKRMHHDDAQVSLKPITKNPMYLHWSVVHTVTADPESAWLVEEGSSAQPDMERIWSTDHNLKLSTKGLYRPMDREELDQITERVERLSA